MVYGGTVPAITPSYSGFVLTDSSSVLTAQPTCSTTATSASPVGSYPSSCSGAAAANYSITYVAGTVNVTAAALTITASSGTMVYGGAVPAITPSYSGFVNGDSAATALTTQPACSTTATSTIAVGSYPSSCSGAAATNYAITYVGGTVKVTAASLTITASSGTMLYGGAVPPISPSYAGFLNGDTAATALTTQPTCSTSASSTSNVGNYASTCSGAVAPNYSITYVAGTVAINPAPLTITASSAAMVYGGAVPAISPIYSGFVNGQNSSVLTTQPACSTTATSASPVGTYPSTCSGAAATNYAITYVAGAVTINKAATATTITANLPNPSIYGQQVTVSFSVAPQFTGTPTGTVKVTASTGETCTGTLSGGVGSCVLIFLTGGSRTLTAAYGGDSNFLASTSGGVTQVVSSVNLSTTALVFGSQLVGTNSARQTITLTNVGSTALAMKSITIVGANPGDFNQSNNCPLGANLAAGRSCSINVRFVPTATGIRTATVQIVDADITSPQSVSLTGTGVQPIATLSPSSYNFGNVTRRTTATFGFTLSNSGTAPLTITNISVTNPGTIQFTQTNNCGTSLAIGASCTITVSFTPTQKGLETGTLSVSDNAPGSPQTAALSGTGI